MQKQQFFWGSSNPYDTYKSVKRFQKVQITTARWFWYLDTKNGDFWVEVEHKKVYIYRKTRRLFHFCWFSLMIPARYCDICDNLVHFDEPKNTCTKGECIFCVRFVTFLRNRCTFCSKSWTFVQILTVKQYFCFLKNMKPAVKTDFCRPEKHGFLFRKHLFLV